MPLHADAERGVRFFDRFDHAVGGAGADDEAVAGPADRLVMPAVDAAAAGGVGSVPQHGREPASSDDLDLVAVEVLRLLDRVRQAALDRRRDVLNQCSASRDVEHLRPAADRQQRHIVGHGAAREVDLELVAARFGIVGQRVTIFTIENRVDVAPAGQQHAVHFAEHLARALGHFENPRPCPCLLDRRNVVVELAAACHPDGEWPFVHGYILPGIEHPIKSSALVSCFLQ